MQFIAFYSGIKCNNCIKYFMQCSEPVGKESVPVKEAHHSDLAKEAERAGDFHAKEKADSKEKEKDNLSEEKAKAKVSLQTTFMKTMMMILYHSLASLMPGVTTMMMMAGSQIQQPII